MTDILAEFAAAAPDGIFIPLFESDGSAFVKQVRAFDGLQGATLIAGLGPFSCWRSSAQRRRGASIFLGRRRATGQAPTVQPARTRMRFTPRSNRRAASLLPLITGRTRTTRQRCCSALSNPWRLRTAELYVDRAALRKEIGATAGFQGITGVLFLRRNSETAAPGTSTSTTTRIRPSRISHNYPWFTIFRSEPAAARPRKILSD